MDIEQLKLVLEAVKGVTSGAIWVAVLYFLLPLTTMLLKCGAWILVLKLILVPIKLLIEKIFRKPDIEEIEKKIEQNKMQLEAERIQANIKNTNKHLETAFLQMLSHGHGKAYSFMLDGKENSEYITEVVRKFIKHVPKEGKE